MPLVHAAVSSESRGNSEQIQGFGLPGSGGLKLCVPRFAFIVLLAFFKKDIDKQQEFTAEAIAGVLTTNSFINFRELISN
jgi:hypothetical protein